MGLNEPGQEGVTWFHLAKNTDKQRAVAATVMNLWVSTKCGESLD